MGVLYEKMCKTKKTFLAWDHEGLTLTAGESVAPTGEQPQVVPCVFALWANICLTASSLNFYTVATNSQSKVSHTFFHTISCSSCFSRSFIIGM